MSVRDVILELWKGAFTWDSCRMTKQQLEEFPEQYTKQTMELIEKYYISKEDIEKRIDSMWNKTNYAIDGTGFYEDIKEMLK